MQDINLECIICEYLTLEEILVLYDHDLKKRDIIINRAYKILPNIHDEIGNGNLNAVKYLYQKGFKANGYSLQCAIYMKHLEMVKYLIFMGVKPMKHEIKSRQILNNIDLTLYLISIGFEIDFLSFIFCPDNDKKLMLDALINYAILNVNPGYINAINTGNIPIILLHSKYVIECICHLRQFSLIFELFEHKYKFTALDLEIIKYKNPQIYTYLTEQKCIVKYV